MRGCTTSIEGNLGLGGLSGGLYCFYEVEQKGLWFEKRAVMLKT